MDTIICKNLEKNLQDTYSVLSTVHETTSFYVDRPVYGRLLGDLEKKQAQFLDILESVQAESEKVLLFKNEIESWSESLFNLMLKDQDFQTKVKSIKNFKNARVQQNSNIVV